MSHGQGGAIKRRDRGEDDALQREGELRARNRAHDKVTAWSGEEEEGHSHSAAAALSSEVLTAAIGEISLDCSLPDSSNTAGPGVGRVRKRHVEEEEGTGQSYPRARRRTSDAGAVSVAGLAAPGGSEEDHGVHNDDDDGDVVEGMNGHGDDEVDEEGHDSSADRARNAHAVVVQPHRRRPEPAASASHSRRGTPSRLVTLHQPPIAPSRAVSLYPPAVSEIAGSHCVYSVAPGREIDARTAESTINAIYALKVAEAVREAESMLRTLGINASFSRPDALRPVTVVQQTVDPDVSAPRPAIFSHSAAHRGAGAACSPQPERREGAGPRQSAVAPDVIAQGRGGSMSREAPPGARGRQNGSGGNGAGTSSSTTSSASKRSAVTEMPAQPSTASVAQAVPRTPAAQTPVRVAPVPASATLSGAEQSTPDASCVAGAYQRARFVQFHAAGPGAAGLTLKNVFTAAALYGNVIRVGNSESGAAAGDLGSIFFVEYTCAEAAVLSEQFLNGLRFEWTGGGTTSVKTALDQVASSPSAEDSAAGSEAASLAPVTLSVRRCVDSDELELAGVRGAWVSFVSNAENRYSSSNRTGGPSDGRGSEVPRHTPRPGPVLHVANLPDPPNGAGSGSGDGSAIAAHRARLVQALTTAFSAFGAVASVRFPPGNSRMALVTLPSVGAGMRALLTTHNALQVLGRPVKVSFAAGPHGASAGPTTGS